MSFMKIECIFDHAGCVPDRLFRIHQRSRSVAEYAVEFSTLAAESGWDEVALQAVFQRGLSGQVHNTLVTGAHPGNLDELIDVDKYQRVRCREWAFVSSPPFSTTRHRSPPIPLSLPLRW